MRHFLTIISFMSVCAVLSAQTSVTEDILQNTTWTVQGSPYVVEKTIEIATEATLTIDPGVVIKHDDFSWNTLFIVNGAIRAQGTIQDPVVFTDIKDDAYGGDTNNNGSANTPRAGDWGGIQLNAGSGASIFEYCIFRFGGEKNINDYDGTIEVIGSSPVIRNCEFVQSEIGLTISAGGSPVVENNLFSGSTEVPVAISFSAQFNFSGNIFQNNAANGIGLLPGTDLTDDSYRLEQRNIGGIPNIPYIVYDDSPVIGESVTLIIDPGVVVKHSHFDWIDMFVVNGTLEARGTVERPIVFTALEDDAYGGDSNNDGSADMPQAGDWGGIRINASSGSASILEHCLFRYGGKKNVNRFDGTVEVIGSDPVIRNCSFFGSEIGLTISEGGRPQVEDNVLSESSKIPIAIALDAEPVFSGNTFENNAANGIGLLPLVYNNSGANYRLSPSNVGGLQNTPYVVYDDSPVIGESVTLLIDPGVIVKHSHFDWTDIFVVNGTLDARGTADKPIVFTALEDDAYGGDTNNDGDADLPRSGDWGGIRINASSESTSILENCLFRFGGRKNVNVFDGVVEVIGSDPVIRHCEFFRSAIGLTISGGGHPQLENILFAESSKVPVAIVPDIAADLTSCVFENNVVQAIGLLPTTYAQSEADYRLGLQTVGGIERIPYVIYDAAPVVSPGVTLTIDPGVVIKHSHFDWNDILVVDGRLVAHGTPDDPIVFTAVEDDTYGGDTNNDGETDLPRVGDWGGIRINAGSGAGSVLKHCVFRYGGRKNVNNFDGAIEILGSNPTIGNTLVEYCERGIVPATASDVLIDSIQFRHNKFGVFSLQTTAMLTVQNSAFSDNERGLTINSGSAKIRHSVFNEQLIFDIENLSSEDIDARQNRWTREKFIAILLAVDQTNLPFLYDQTDSGQLGRVDVSEPVPTAEGVFAVTPDKIILNDETRDTVTVRVVGYRFGEEAPFAFFSGDKELNTWVVSRDTVFLEVAFALPQVEQGAYDFELINGPGDTLRLQQALSIQDIETIAFDEWVPFSVTRGEQFASAVQVPEVDQLFMLVKKTAIGRQFSSWSGRATLRRNGGERAYIDEGKYSTISLSTNSDYDVHILDAEQGVYFFELESFAEGGDGRIKFTDELPELPFNEWATGNVLRPYGFDWFQFTLPEGVDTLFLRTEGYGMESSIEVFYGYLENYDQRWVLGSTWFGNYSIRGSIPNPPAGRYFLRYKDSAILVNEDGSQDREYLIYAGLDESPPDRQLPLEITSVSNYELGQARATIEIEGAGFSATDEIRLSRNGEVIETLQQEFDEERNVWIACFDLVMAQSGAWELQIQNASGAVATAPRAIIIEAAEDFDIQLEVLSRDQIRTGRRQPIVIKVTNHGNVDALVLPVFVQLEPVAEIGSKENFEVYEFMDTIISPETWSELFAPYWPTWDDVPFYLEELDTLTGRRYSHASFIIPVLKPGETRTVELNVKYMQSGDNQLSVVLGRPILMNDGSNGPILKNGKKVYLIDPGWKECIDKLLEVLLDELQDRLAEDIVDLIAGKWDDCGRAATEAMTDQYKNLANITRGKEVSMQDFFLPFGSVLYECGTEALKTAGKKFPIVAIIDALYKIWKALNDLKNEIEKRKEVLDACSEPLDDILKDIPSIGSITPEDKFGPAGFDYDTTSLANRRRFINSPRTFAYRVDYWNREDATAPAAEVFIRDTIRENFNLSTFNFTEFGFLRWKVPLKGGDYFNVNVDLRPDFDLIVNVEGTINPKTREVFWAHRSLDPKTLELPEDPLAGYLPPIDTNGYHIGYVSYTIQPEEDLPSGAVFENQAHVNFDGVGPWGPAPPYGPYRNTYDFDAPSSQVLPLDMTSFEEFTVTWEGTDGDGSGLRDYTIYVAEDDGPYRVWLADTSATSGLFRGEEGKLYRFYSIARDNVGQVEEAPGLEDAMTSVITDTEDILDLSGVRLYPNIPNPLSSSTLIRFDIPVRAEVILEVVNPLGQKEILLRDKRPAGSYAVEWSPGNQAPGVYFYRLRVGDVTLTRRMVYLR